jgi:tetratricopeptide (TPR) repeat protein
MRLTSRAASAFLFLALPGLAIGQELPPSSHCASPPSALPADVKERPIGLEPGAGVLRQKVSARSEEAQAFYDQGIAYLASYVWIDAARSFHEALRRDEGLAMAHLGLARAFIGLGDDARARTHADRAATLVSGPVTEKEKRWIAATRLRLDARRARGEGKDSAHKAYVTALDELIALDPADPHAWVLRGNAEEPSRAWGTGQFGEVGAIAFYEAALARDPAHMGAHHFLVHSYENIRRYAEAAEHGRVFAQAAPGVPHAQHMWAHVLPRVGDWTRALAQMSAADRLHREYFAALGVSPAEDWHYPHNLHVLATIHLRLGQEADAARLYEEGFRLGKSSIAPWVEYLLLRGRNEEALAAAREGATRTGSTSAYVGAALSGQALLALGRAPEARRALRATEEAYERMLRSVRDQPGEWQLPRHVGHHLKTLQALVALERGQAEKADAILLEVADQFARQPGIDAWASGLVHLDRVAALARRAGRERLAASVEERIRRIDPDMRQSNKGGLPSRVGRAATSW